MAAGNEIWKLTRKRKTATRKAAEKIVLAETKNKLIVGIQLIVGIRPIVVEPQATVIVVQVENVRIAIGVGLCDTPSLPLPTQFFHAGRVNQRCIAVFNL